MTSRYPNRTQIQLLVDSMNIEWLLAWKQAIDKRIEKENQKHYVPA